MLFTIWAESEAPAVGSGSVDLVSPLCFCFKESKACFFWNEQSSDGKEDSEKMKGNETYLRSSLGVLLHKS